MSQTIHVERISRCSICRQLADMESVDYIWDADAHLPMAVQRLENVLTLGYAYPVLMRCPECGTYYLYNVACGYMEHDESYERLSDEQAFVYLHPKTGGG